jgi:hypothetical protein
MTWGERKMPVFRDSEPEDDRIENFARSSLYERFDLALLRVIGRALANEHTHIAQVDNGVPGCPKCERIDPEHMTREYVVLARAQDQIERTLRE